MKAEATKRANKWVRKGDRVIVTTGDDKGTVGEVLLRSDTRVIIGGVNVVKKHVKPTKTTQGSIQEIEKSIDVSNVALVDEAGKAIYPKVRFSAEGNKELVYQVNGETQVLRAV